MYIGFDPGPVTGIARVNNRGQVIDISMVSLDRLPEHLEGIPTVAILQAVMEKYRQLPHRLAALAARKTNKGEVMQAEGVIKSWCKRNKIPLAEQPATVLPIGSKHTGIVLPRDHSQSHGHAALIHVKEWMIMNGLDKTLLQQQQEASK
jgi:hypothetical protein